MKPKLLFPDLVLKLNEKNIDNGTYTPEEIIEYLSQRSYYYKISSYRKNFPKDAEGKYVSLTFNHLVAVAKLDVRLREYFLNLCLDVEHSTRTNLMTILTEDIDEDGYTIIENFQDEFPEKFNDILEHFRNNKYKKDMFTKRTQISVWVFMEIIDYGTLIQFLEFYRKKATHRDKLYPVQHKFIKNVRNTCAHNDVFLINLFDKEDFITRPAPATKSFANDMNINNGLVRYPKVVDIINLFYVHKRICSNDLNSRRFNEGKVILEKYYNETDLFNISVSLKKFFESILVKCIDFLDTND
ncbi:Abi family protein [Streptococcus uberis]|uniref:Abi family protein n=1 Tax=Streptococcus uberis TaxID=1349 RepID=UPI0027DB247D|nr:Abi family protein [Streptococcus uberis]MCK1240996.1 Abi family protein [Streptococcus uberis]